MTCSRRMLVLLAACVSVASATWTARADAPAKDRTVEVVRSAHTAVVAGHPEATRLGLDVLDRGGTAADALVTVATVLGVVEPGNSGLGGKLVMLYYDAPTKRVTCVVALGESPGNADAKQLPQDKARGIRIACTPGQVAGLAEVHNRFGKKPWTDLVTPAADLAEKGFTLTQRDAELMTDFPLDVDAEARKIYAIDGRHPKAGEVMRNPDLARTLRTLAREGPDSFYHGTVAKQLAAAIQSAGGSITEQDLASYQPRVLEPVSTTIDGLTFYSSPPPLTGGTTVLSTYAVLAQADWSKAAPRNAVYVDHIARALQQVYREVNRKIADTPESFAESKRILSADSIQDLADRAWRADVRQPDQTPTTKPVVMDDRVLDDLAHASTTHLTIVDAQGSVAVVTTSLGLHFGCAAVAPGTGILLNNDINNFALQTPTSANYLKPHKMPRSTMAPTLVLKDGKPVLAIGSPGGARIPVMVVQVMTDLLRFGRAPGEAIAAPRFHVKRSSTGGNDFNMIETEPGFDESVADDLKKLGWDVQAKQKEGFYFGSVNAVMFNADGSMTAVADPRRSADAEGR
ncbi:MAG: gamma-glutamyltransferase [Tepidisphaeraceae bacterium]